MPLTHAQTVYLDDLQFEYQLLLSAAIEAGEVRQGTTVCTGMQEFVDAFRAKHPEADHQVQKGVGRKRPNRPASSPW